MGTRPCSPASGLLLLCAGAGAVACDHQPLTCCSSVPVPAQVSMMHSQLEAAAWKAAQAEGQVHAMQMRLHAAEAQVGRAHACCLGRARRLGFGEQPPPSRVHAMHRCNTGCSCDPQAGLCAVLAERGGWVWACSRLPVGCTPSTGALLLCSGGGRAKCSETDCRGALVSGIFSGVCAQPQMPNALCAPAPASARRDRAACVILC